jgi:hypothetical protein
VIECPAHHNMTFIRNADMPVEHISRTDAREPMRIVARTKVASLTFYSYL